MGYLFNGEGSSITAQRIADVLAGFLGSGTYITNLGNKMAASIKDNNTVRVSDGVALQEGRAIIVAASSYDDFTIPTGSQGVTTTYYLGYHITTGSGGEETPEIIVSTTKTDSGSMRDGDSGMYIWLYSATQNGLVLESVKQIASSIGSVADGIPGITYGTSNPDDSDGMADGSIYLKYEG